MHESSRQWKQRRPSACHGPDPAPGQFAHLICHRDGADDPREPWRVPPSPSAPGPAERERAGRRTGAYGDSPTSNVAVSFGHPGNIRRRLYLGFSGCTENASALKTEAARWTKLWGACGGASGDSVHATHSTTELPWREI